MIVVNNLDVAVPVGDVSIASFRFGRAIANRNAPKGRGKIGYEVFYLSSCVLGLVTALAARKGLNPRRLELATYGLFAAGTMGHLKVEQPGAAGKTVCALQGAQCLWVFCNWDRTYLPLLGLGGRAVGITAWFFGFN